jgi:hypothetical protein
MDDVKLALLVLILIGGMTVAAAIKLRGFWKISPRNVRPSELLPIRATEKLPSHLSPSRFTLAFYGASCDKGEKEAVEYHDHGIALMKGGVVIAVLELERVSRFKQDGNLSAWLDNGLASFEQYGVTYDNVDVVSVNAMQHVSLKSSRSESLGPLELPHRPLKVSQQSNNDSKYQILLLPLLAATCYPLFADFNHVY